MSISNLYFLISMLYIEPSNETKENRQFMKYRARKYVGISHMTCKRLRLSFTLIERDEQVPLQVHFSIMIRNFFKILAEFTLFSFLFFAKTSFGSLYWRMSSRGMQVSMRFTVGLVTEKTQPQYFKRKTQRE